MDEFQVNFPTQQDTFIVEDNEKFDAGDAGEWWNVYVPAGTYTRTTKGDARHSAWWRKENT